MQHQFTGDRAVAPLESPRLRATCDKQVHAFVDVGGEFLRPVTPDLGLHPVDEFALADAPVAGEVDIEHGLLSVSMNEFYGTDIGS